MLPWPSGIERWACAGYCSARMLRRQPGIQAYPNDELANICRANPDLFVGFAGINPWKGKLAVAELERAIKTLGLRGAKFHPVAQKFIPGDRQFDPLWEVASELGAICLFHTGMMAAGAGTPGAARCWSTRARFTWIRWRPASRSSPLWPRTRGWPWHEELLAIMRHKSNVHVDLSGYLPRYLPESFLKMATSLLQDQVLFGSDYPFIMPDRWLADFEHMDLKSTVREKILRTNAERLLGWA